MVPGDLGGQGIKRVSDTSFPLDTQALQPGAQAPFVRLPNPDSLFLRRADRFDRIALSRQPKDFFVFMGILARAQEAAVRRLNLLDSPAPSEIERRRAAGLPPLAAASIKLGVSWQAAFTGILRELAGAALPAQTNSAIERARQLDAAVVEAWASALLRQVYKPVDPAIAPLISAALQVYWAKMAHLCDADTIVRLTPPGNCPVCGSPPVSGIVSAEPVIRGNRYLCCSLCATQWRMARITCSNCESTEEIAYYGIEGGDQALKAESCEKCKVYLKLLYMEKGPGLDPVADDAGSIALDLLLGEAGWHRLTPVSFVFPSQE
jgi:FdhE protein